MTRLIPIPGSSPTEHGAAVQWINPDRIVAVTPKMTGHAPSITLAVEIKLEGIPLFTAHFGHYRSIDDADERWQRFLAEIQTT